MVANVLRSYRNFIAVCLARCSSQLRLGALKGHPENSAASIHAPSMLDRTPQATCRSGNPCGCPGLPPKRYGQRGWSVCRPGGHKGRDYGTDTQEQVPRLEGAEPKLRGGADINELMKRRMPRGSTYAIGPRKWWLFADASRPNGPMSSTTAVRRWAEQTRGVPLARRMRLRIRPSSP